MLRPRFLWKLYAGYVALTLLFLAVVGIFVARRLIQDARQQTHAALLANAVLLRDIATPVLDHDTGAQLRQRLRQIGDAIGTRFTIIRANGTVVADSDQEGSRMDNHHNRPEIDMARRQDIGTATRFSQTLGQQMMYLALAVRTRGTLQGYVRTALPLSVMKKRFARLRAIVFFGAGVIAIVGLSFGFLFAHRLTQPLMTMTNAVRALIGEDDHRTSRARGQDEIGELTDAFNRMASRLRERMDTITHERNQLLAVLSSMVEGVIAVDQDERVVHMNQVAGTMLRAAPEKSIGKHLWEVTRARTIMETISATLQEAAEITREAHIEQPEDKVFTLNAAPLRDGNAALVGAVLVLHDVTELRRLENVRRDFVANVSHELKTPITTIKGFVETLREGALDDRVQAERFLSIVARNADRLHAIIEDLLSLSRLDQHSEGADLPRIDTPLLSVLQSAVQTSATKAAARQVGIKVACDDTLVARINPPLLEQAVVNLLDNAINYSKVGDTVWLEAEHQGDDIAIRVRDAGIGIPQEHVNRLFERFYRVERARSRDHGGTGLGLAIVKHIMQFHGGRVSVVSTVGQGSTFILSLPAGDGSPATGPDANALSVAAQTHAEHQFPA